MALSGAFEALVMASPVESCFEVVATMPAMLTLSLNPKP